ncbi:MAG: zf-HC2 domain-containing protein [bacterium]|nr:zf-HC2 domain-containing protein [bacterium]
MEHKNIKGKLLLYIDNELSQPEMMEVKTHIDVCADCREHLTVISGLWRLEKVQKQEAPRYIWTRLAAEIKEYEHNPVLFDIFYSRKKFAYIFQPAVMVILVFISVLTGYFGGNFLSREINGNQVISNNEQVARVFYLDRLETEHISNAMTIASNENGEEILP